MIRSHSTGSPRSEVSTRRRRQLRRVIGVCIWVGALTILVQRLEPRPSRDADAQRVSLAVGVPALAPEGGLANQPSLQTL